MSTLPPDQDRFLREREVLHITGLSRTTRWRLEREGKFPKRIEVTENTKRNLLSHVLEWMAARVKAA